MAIIATVSLTVLSVLTVGTDVFSKVFQSPISPTSPNPFTSPSALPTSVSSAAGSTSSRPQQQQPVQEEDEQEELHGLWTISELRTSTSSSRSHSHSRTTSSSSHIPTNRQRTEEDHGLPSYESALASPPMLLLGRKGVRLLMGEEEAPPGYEDVCSSSSSAGSQGGNGSGSASGSGGRR